MSTFGPLMIACSYGRFERISASAPASAAGQQVPGYPDDLMALDAREVAVLPRYCKYTQVFRDKMPGGRDQAQLDYWYSTLGPGFHSMHHYCFGLMKINRAMRIARTPQQWKTFYLGSAIDEFDFVLQSVSSDFLLLPEILTKKGENLILLGQGPRGMVELERAIDVKADYWPPYAALADYYKGIGNFGKARAVLERGLSIMPDAKPLSTRLGDLDQGKAKAKSTGRGRTRISDRSACDWSLTAQAPKHRSMTCRSEI